MLPRAAASDLPVLITGETGTGKELCARAIHHLSRRNRFPFIALDCTTVPEHLFENEVFGHSRGAFTDARSDSRGLIGMAEGGTLLLDEIDSLSLAAQSKLLRFIQERTYRPLGSDKVLKADVNIIAATNRDLKSSVAKNQFRIDLYYRINVVNLHLPALRDRASDIELLARHFLHEAKQSGAEAKRLSRAAIVKLQMYNWPGNVRELANVIHRAQWLADTSDILPCHIGLPPEDAVSDGVAARFRECRALAIAEFERTYVERVLRSNSGNVTRAAREAGKERRAFGRLIKKYGLSARAG
jgi:DNA-binding NtrC family response regulator